MRLVSVQGRGVIHIAYDANPAHPGRIKTVCPAIRKTLPWKRYQFWDNVPSTKRLCHLCANTPANRGEATDAE